MQERINLLQNAINKTQKELFNKRLDNSIDQWVKDFQCKIIEDNLKRLTYMLQNNIDEQ